MHLQELGHQNYTESAESPTRDPRDGEVTSPQLVLKFLRSRPEYQTVQGGSPNTSIVSEVDNRSTHSVNETTSNIPTKQEIPNISAKDNSIEVYLFVIIPLDRISNSRYI